MRKFQLLVTVALSGLLFFFYTNCASSMNSSMPVDPSPVAPASLNIKKLKFTGIGSGGIFDPSITYDPISNKLWMSFSSVEPSTQFPAQNKIAPHTRLAYSIDKGESWIDIGAVNATSDVNLPLTAPNNAGTWMNEVSTLVYDPGAGPNERWKLMWQTFLKINGAPHFEHSWITLKVSSTPEGLLIASPVKLFTSFLYDSANNSAAAVTIPPLATVPAFQIDTSFSQLTSCVVAEPGLYASSTALYMTAQCEQFNDPANANDNDRLIVLLKCMSPCNTTNAASWTFVRQLFNRADSIAAEPAYNGGYAAPALIDTPNGVYLIVTPTQEPDAIYRGCTVFKFSDLDTGLLQKTAAGIPTIIKKVEGTSGLFRGACGYNGKASSGGVMLSELSDLTGNGEFQIFQTRITF